MIYVQNHTKDSKKRIEVPTLICVFFCNKFSVKSQCEQNQIEVKTKRIKENKTPRKEKYNSTFFFFIHFCK